MPRRTIPEHFGVRFVVGALLATALVAGCAPRSSGFGYWDSMVILTEAFKDDAEAREIANSTVYGLGSGLWTANLQRAHRLAKAIHAGR